MPAPVPRLRPLLWPLVLAGGAPSPAQAALEARVAETLDRARPALLYHLHRADLGELALCTLAALHDGVPLDHQQMARAIRRLSRARLDDTYGLALRLMVMAEVPAFPDRDELAASDAEMLRARQTSGGFSYHEHDGWWDLSNTQYAALGLRAAAALGQPTPEPVWKLLYQTVRAMQHEDGGFTYRPSQGESSAYESMTVAGIAVLQVCAQMLELEPDDRQRHDLYVARSWEWMAARKESIGDRRTENSHYFLYGLERAAILSDVEQVGDVDWYAAGATLLCEQQLGGGGWWGNDEIHGTAPKTRRGHPVDTSFAVLFLRRKFQKVQAPVTGPRALLSRGLGAEAGDDAVREAARRDAGRGDAAMPDLLALLHSDVATRRCAAVLAIHAITGQDFGIQPLREPDDDRDAIRSAELWWLRNRGSR